ncbi:MAG TPA: hypothetical protein VMS38_19360 [Pseudorhodoferax sp.]|nr:hypothetical protein [Pseudorhodoferax sp.]
MTEAEATYMAHIKDNARAWRWTRSEVLASAEHYARLDPYQLARLPQLLQAEIDKAKEMKA